MKLFIFACTIIFVIGIVWFNDYNSDAMVSRTEMPINKLIHPLKKMRANIKIVNHNVHAIKNKDIYTQYQLIKTDQYGVKFFKAKEGRVTVFPDGEKIYLPEIK